MCRYVINPGPMKTDDMRHVWIFIRSWTCRSSNIGLVVAIKLITARLVDRVKSCPSSITLSWVLALRCSIDEINRFGPLRPVVRTRSRTENSRLTYILYFVPKFVLWQNQGLEQDATCIGDSREVTDHNASCSTSNAAGVPELYDSSRDYSSGLSVYSQNA